MSDEMADKKKQDEEEIERQLKEEEEAMKSDVCPHCLQSVTTYPYVVTFPILGWVECAACGVIFSPKSIRNLKKKKAESKIIT